MSVNDAQKFRGITHWGETDYITELENNLYVFLNYAFLKIGAWRNVQVPTQTPYGRLDRLRLLPNPSFNSGQIWQAARKDWVWETGINYTGVAGTGVYNPIDVEILVNGVAPTGDYAVNYPLGMVYFDQAVPATNDVTASYSYRLVQIYVAETAEWWKQIQRYSLRLDQEGWSNSDFNEGIYSIMAQNRVQLPAIVIEGVARGESKPYQLGTTSSWVIQDIMFYVIAEDRQTRNKITDILRRQKGRSFFLYDTDSVQDSGHFPLNVSGDRVADAKTYVNYIVDHRDQVVRWDDVQISEVESGTSKFFFSVVRGSFELIA